MTSYFFLCVTLLYSVYCVIRLTLAYFRHELLNQEKRNYSVQRKKGRLADRHSLLRFYSPLIKSQSHQAFCVNRNFCHLIRLYDSNIGVGRFRILVGGGQGLEYLGGGAIPSRHMTS